MERQPKEIKGFPGLMEKVKLEPVVENTSKKGKAKATPAPVETDKVATAGKKNGKKKEVF